MTLSQRDRKKRLWVNKDASDNAWSGIVTQVPVDDLHKQLQGECHNSLAFSTGRINSTHFGWSILERERYAVKATQKRMYWMVLTPDGFYLFTDHDSLILCFDQISVVPDL